MSKELKVGLIGAGSIAQCHAEAIDALDNIKVVAVSDRSSERAESIAKPRNICKIYTDYHEMLEDAQIEAVIVATPTFTHHDIIIDALRKGKHVFCEKPPALNAAQVEECIEASKQTGKILMFGLVCRFSPRVEKFKEIIEEGRCGDFYYAEAMRTQQVTNINGWFLNKAKAGGGELIDGCIHEIDQVLYLMNYPKPKYVCAMTSYANLDLPSKVLDIPFDWVSAEASVETTSVESLAGAMVFFENGSALSIKSGRYMFAEKGQQGYRMLGTEGGITYNGSQCFFTAVDESKHISTEELELPKGVNAFEKEFEHFADCCINNKETRCNNNQIVVLMKIMDAIYKSAETKEPVYIR